jgi:hypothetical protein
VIPRADLVFRVDPRACFGAGAKLRSRGVLLVVLGAPILFVGVLSTAYAILAIAWHHFPEGDRLDVVAAVLGFMVLSVPLAVGVLLTVLGVRRLRRGALLVELAGLAHGKTHVTVLDLASRTGKRPEVVLASLTLAERHRAATRL